MITPESLNLKPLCDVYQIMIEAIFDYLYRIIFNQTFNSKMYNHCFYLLSIPKSKTKFKLFFVLLFFNILFVTAQKKDSLGIMYDQYLSTILKDVSKAKQNFKKLSEKAFIAKNYNIYLKSLLTISYCDLNLDDPNETIKSCNFTIHEAKKYNNKAVEIKALSFQSLAYSTLGLFDESRESIDNALIISEAIDNESDSMKMIRGNLFFSKYEYFSQKKELQNALLANNNSIKEYLKLKNPDAKSEMLIPAYINNAMIYRDLKQIDSMKVYTQKSFTLNPEKFQHFGVLSECYTNFGVYYQAKKETQKAEQNFEKAIELAEKYHVINSRLDAYKYAHQFYSFLNNEKKHEKYLIKFQKLNDSINAISKQKINETVKNIVKNKQKTTKNNYTKIIGFLTIAIILLIFVCFFALSHSKKLKNKNLITSDLLKKKEVENTILEAKINESFEELTQLAKENSPNFYVKFSEIYPEINQTLSKEHPQLSTFEKSFLAMVFLNFSNKELASIESVSLKTIEIRKYRIRKKCNLESGQDLKKWLDELANLKIDYQ